MTNTIQQVALPKDHPLMRAWARFCKTDEFKNALRWAVETKYDDGREIGDIQREQHAKGAMWLAFTAGMEQAVQVELPRYRCHKEVQALKIKAVILFPHPPCMYQYGATTCGYGPNERMHHGSTDPIIPPAGRHDYAPMKPSNQEEFIIAAMIHPEDEQYAAFPVDHVYMDKHNPQVGGYYIVYKDGYRSYSPAQAFEEGYTRI